jgi:pilus assembly protein Flp/PilA
MGCKHDHRDKSRPKRDVYEAALLIEAIALRALQRSVAHSIIQFDLQRPLEMRAIIAFLTDRSGATSIEYAMIASGIAVAVVAAVNNLGSAVKSSYTSVSVALK